jgi:penicillin-binding protein 1C
MSPARVAASVVCRGGRRRWLLATPVFLLGISVGSFRAAVAWWPYPAGIDRPPAASTWIIDRDGRPLAAFAAADGQWCQPLPAEAISPHLLDAVVAVEDERFYRHGGVDWRSAAGAAWQDLTSLSLRRGASTIAMQLQHLRQPTPRRSVLGKLAQVVRACQIERQSSKRDVLVEYLNRAPFGGNLTGVGAASWRYFGRPCSALSLGQAALLAGLPQSPNRYRPDRHPMAAAARRDHVLDRMVACGMISTEERRAAAAEPVDAAWRPLPQDATDVGLRPTLDRLARLYPGRTLRTTIDWADQRRTAAAADDALRSLAPSHVSAAAVVVLDTASGACLAAVSRSGGDVDLTIRPRSSGSTLKPFIYAAAFDAGACQPGSVLDDAPAAWSGYAPGDYDRRFDGPEPAAVALARSRNVPTLLVLSRVGVQRAVGVMGGVGLLTVARTPDRYGLSLAVGGAEVTPMELAGAYATLGRGGVAVPVTLEQVSFSGRPQGAPFGGPTSAPSGRPLNGTGDVLRPSSCLQALQCLSDPDRTRAVWPAAVPLGVAWKTGTSSGHRDAWCAAVTPRRTVVAWLGNADGGGSDALVGQEAAAPLALRVMAAVDSGGPGFAPPPGLLTLSAPAVPRGGAGVQLVSPTDREEIIRDPSTPADRQRVALRARAAGTVWYFVDGSPVGTDVSDRTVWWDPTDGGHDVRAVDATGHAAVVHIRVR